MHLNPPSRTKAPHVRGPQKTNLETIIIHHMYTIYKTRRYRERDFALCFNSLICRSSSRTLISLQSLSNSASAFQRADAQHCSGHSCSVLRPSERLLGYLVAGIWYLWYLIPVVSDTWYQVPEHLFRKPEHLFRVSEHLFMFGEHCSGSALVGKSVFGTFPWIVRFYLRGKPPSG